MVFSELGLAQKQREGGGKQIKTGAEWLITYESATGNLLRHASPHRSAPPRDLHLRRHGSRPSSLSLYLPICLSISRQGNCMWARDVGEKGRQVTKMMHEGKRKGKREEIANQSLRRQHTSEETERRRRRPPSTRWRRTGGERRRHWSVRVCPH